MVRSSRSAGNAAGEETRARLVEAALGALREVGIVGASSRVVARRAGVNQALIFYHFGSYEGLVAAAARIDSERRAAAYAQRLAEVETLAQLVEVARELHAVERRTGSIKVLAQLLAAASTAPELKAELHAALGPWLELVGDALQRALAPTPFGPLVSDRDAALTIASLFVGIELVAELGDPGGPDQLLDFLGNLAAVAASFVRPPAP
jgi:AcrR family transcriptional regulator